MAITREFVFEKATKNTWRFQEEAGEEAPIIGALYIQKHTFLRQPAKIVITVAEVEVEA